MRRPTLDKLREWRGVREVPPIASSIRDAMGDVAERARAGRVADHAVSVAPAELRAWLRDVRAVRGGVELVVGPGSGKFAWTRWLRAGGAAALRSAGLVGRVAVVVER